MAGPELAVTVSRAKGLGFIGPNTTIEGQSADLEQARKLISSGPASPFQVDPKKQEADRTLPIGIGFQLWDSDMRLAASLVKTHQPCAAWLFAPRNGQEEIDSWTSSIRNASPNTQIWLQVGTLHEAVIATQSKNRPDVLVIQGSEAGGHGRATDGTSIMTLFPEVADKIRDSGIPLLAAGGIADGRGVVAALGLGAAGIIMGTRFLAAREARISKGYQQEIVRATDGGVATTRTMIYNHLRGTMGWPEQFSPRGLTNRSFTDHQAGVTFEKLQALYQEAVKTGDSGWGPEGRLATYAGTAVGLIQEVQAAGEIVEWTREEAKAIIQSLVI
ncbi:hypothetical protein H2198_001571 [Neophaeococcomyces mojaviensis]|uniref:Uncharacterized protein n=1 Tax=Neophaeococcomyces mojaviensis TaxID=3383035 RepID=A0ACC3AGE9_9EURO|nr:hypothetical protein H2198_001571 [Knufia sp. JES_112]